MLNIKYHTLGNFRAMKTFLMQKSDHGNIWKGHPLVVNLRMENTIEINICIIQFCNLPQHPKFFMLQKLPNISM